MLSTRRGVFTHKSTQIIHNITPVIQNLSTPLRITPKSYPKGKNPAPRSNGIKNVKVENPRLFSRLRNSHKTQSNEQIPMRIPNASQEIYASPPDGLSKTRTMCRKPRRLVSQTTKMAYFGTKLCDKIRGNRYHRHQIRRRYPLLPYRRVYRGQIPIVDEGYRAANERHRRKTKTNHFFNQILYGVDAKAKIRLPLRHRRYYSPPQKSPRDFIYSQCILRKR